VAALLDTDGNGGFDETTHFVYAGQAAWQLVEEYPSAVPTWSSVQGEEDHDTTVERSYAYGNYIDEVLTMRDHGSGEDFFYHQDDLFSVYAMTDEDGVVVERYEYGDYGHASITAEDGTPRVDALGHAESAIGNRHTFTGRLLDRELTLDDGIQALQYRHRYMATGTGKFFQRDPRQYFASLNLYGYVNDRPLALADPFGEYPTIPLTPMIDPVHWDDMHEDWILIPATIVLEPLDICLTTVEIIKDPTNPFSYCGLIPGVPGKAKKPFEWICSKIKLPWRRQPSTSTPSGPKKSPNFVPPTNPPSLPPTEIPPGWRIREMPPAPGYPDGYWKLEKPLPDGFWQPIDPSTMKPGGRPQTHVPFPPGHK